MTEFTIRITSERTGEGMGIEFDVKTSPKSPTQNELGLLSDYLTPKGQKALSDALEAHGKQNRQSPPKKASA